MTKTLDALDRLYTNVNKYSLYGKGVEPIEDFDIIEEELLHAEENRKKAKAFNIIRKKFVDVHHLMLHCNCVEDYNEYAIKKGTKLILTQEEFDFLREVLL